MLALIDHAIRKPARIVLNGIATTHIHARGDSESTPTPLSEEEIQTVLATGDPQSIFNIPVGTHNRQRPGDIYRYLVDLLDRRVTVDVYTPFGHYPNMLITDVSGDHSGDIGHSSAGNLPITITLEEHLAVELDGFEQVGEGAEKTIPVPHGHRSMKLINSFVGISSDFRFDQGVGFRGTGGDLEFAQTGVGLSGSQSTVLESIVEFVPWDSGPTRQSIIVTPGLLSKLSGRQNLRRVQIEIVWSEQDSAWFVNAPALQQRSELSEIASSLPVEISIPSYITNRRIISAHKLFQWNNGWFVIIPLKPSLKDTPPLLDAWGKTHYFGWISNQYSNYSESVYSVVEPTVQTDSRNIPLSINIINGRADALKRLTKPVRYNDDGVPDYIPYYGNSAEVVVPKDGLNNGVIEKTLIVNPGTGYTSKVRAVVKGGQGLEAVLQPSLVNARIFEVKIITGGKGYHPGTKIYVKNPEPSWWGRFKSNKKEILAATIVGSIFGPIGAVVGLVRGTAIAAGKATFGYIRDQIVEDDSGGKYLKPVVVSGVIESVNIINEGSGFTSEAYLDIDNPSGSGAQDWEYEIVLYDASIGDVEVKNGGYGYTS